MAINHAADPFVLTSSFKMPILTHTPPADRNPELDQEIDLGYSIESGDGTTYTYPGILSSTASLHGTWLNVGIVADPFVLTAETICTFSKGHIWEVDPFEFTAELSEPHIDLGRPRKNWVKWSNIGSVDFTIWKDNVAGERPIDWSGWVYAVKKLANKIVVYGQNGVTLLTPLNNFWGMITISHLGLLYKGAVCGTDFVHFFIDKQGKLCRLDEKIEVFGYEEYLSTLGPSVVMSYDELNQLIYICDGLIGFVYSVRSNSLGQGPVSVTGIGVQDNELYIVSSTPTITIEPFELCTDIHDFGNRKNKTITSLMIGTDVTQTLYAAIDYRNDKSAAFASTPWVRVNPNGIANLPCFGVEFRFKLKLLTYEQFELDYIRVNGVVHNYSYLDTFGKERG
jgi:hypothetical protein